MKVANWRKNEWRKMNGVKNCVCFNKVDEPKEKYKTMLGNRPIPLNTEPTASI